MSPAEEQRFRELYDRTYERALAFVLRRLPDENAASDVVSETFLVAWRRISDVPTETRMADAWIFATARRVLANTRRGNKRRVSLIERLRQRPVDLFVDFSAEGESNEEVMQAFQFVKPSQREILGLAYWDDLDPEQIAHVLGCTKNAAATRLTRAKDALRKAMEREGGER